MRNVKTIIIAVASVAVIGFAINAFAHGAWAGAVVWATMAKVGIIEVIMVRDTMTK